LKLKNLRVSQVEPPQYVVHVHTLGLVHVPPLPHGGEQTAT